jgi:hypothetical protein
LNDWAAQQSTALLGFIAAGFTLQSAEALASLLGQIGRPTVAAVSAKLISAQGRPLGPLLATVGADGQTTVAAAYRGAHQQSNTGYTASLLLDRQVFALQAGCLFVKTSLFRRAGGWARPLSDGLLAGIDLSLRLRVDGLSLVWNAQAPAQSGSSATDATIENTALDVSSLGPQYTAYDWQDNNANKNLIP